MTISLHAVVVDCADAEALARFWADVLGERVDKDPSTDFASLGMGADAPTPPHWMFVRVPEARRGKNRIHVDLIASDREGEVDRVVALGATRVADFDEDGARWTTLADPEGNLFDVVAG